MSIRTEHSVRGGNSQDATGADDGRFATAAALAQAEREPGDFRSIHDAFRPRILRYVARIAGPGEAEDLTQAVLLRVSESLPRFRGESSLSTWIYRIATNAALDSLRLRKHALEGRAQPAPGRAGEEDGSEEGILSDGPETPSVETMAIREEMNSCIREFIERLPQNYRTVMVLSALEGFANAEIAAILGVSLDTVKIRLHRARERLRKDLESGCSLHRDERSELACDRRPAASALPSRTGEE